MVRNDGAIESARAVIDSCRCRRAACRVSARLPGDAPPATRLV